MKSTLINLWSGPRNISTAIMYSFAQRRDTRVVDEPLYAHYLSKTNAASYHPGAQEVLESMQHDGQKIMNNFLDFDSQPFLFLKQMTHHLIELNLDFMKHMEHIVLTRNPIDMLPSFAKEVKNPVMKDVGYQAHHDLIEHLHTKGQEVIVIDSKDILLDPEKMLKKICNRLKMPFDQQMLTWETGPREEDGIWAKHWYKKVHESSGFLPLEAKNITFPKELEPLLHECMPLYEGLRNLAI